MDVALQSSVVRAPDICRHDMCQPYGGILQGLTGSVKKSTLSTCTSREACPSQTACISLPAGKALLELAAIGCTGALIALIGI